ncbi:hypothetical protein LWF15_26085 [Kineosporia rhizophila]|uniref:hypothetical protein n=1 Tax=Kineosporia rhizophila TaxID=84633 RepID=UPI001E654B08|nr:hypothetical protein [Kineosporia rhizophila]MCE0538973.1 hypothetical protein [Kineosporia rhizophila]
MDITRGQLLRGAALAGLAVTSTPAVAQAWPGSADAKGKRRDVPFRGVTYGVNSGESPTTGWEARRMRSDMKAIRERLHANTVAVMGDGVERLSATATEAAERGLTVFLQPRLGDVPEAEILEHLAESGRVAEQLRKDGAWVRLSVGCEFWLFVPGIVPGENALERVQNLLKGNFDAVHMSRELQRFIGLSARTGRRVFKGRLTYGAAEDDEVDWKLFDLVSVNYYSHHRKRRDYLRDLRTYQAHGKPVIVQEFGSCTFVGAPEAGGMGWNVVDYEKDPAEVPARIVRSEKVQADHLVRLYDVFAEAGIHAATVYDFVSPDSQHNPTEPRYDYDTASYSIVKAVGQGKNWHWEPKLAFHALSRRWCPQN